MKTNPLPRPPSSNSEMSFDLENVTLAFHPRKARVQKPDPSEKVLRVLVACFGSVIQDRIFERNSTVTIGSHRRATLRIPTEGLSPRHPLFTYGEDGSLLASLNPYFKGYLDQGDRVLAIDAPLTEENLQVGRNPKICLQHGPITIYAEEISKSDAPKRPSLTTFIKTKEMKRWWFLSMGTHVLFLILFLLIPSTPHAKMNNPKPIKKSDFVKFTPKLVVREEGFGKKSIQGSKDGSSWPGGPGERAPGKEGARKMTRAGTRSKQPSAEKKGRGVLDFLSKNGKTGSFADLLSGGSALPDSVDAQIGKADRFGRQDRFSTTRQGKGLNGDGPGGDGPISSVGDGLSGEGSGTGTPSYDLPKIGPEREQVSVQAPVTFEGPTYYGNIPKEKVAEIIRNHLGQIRYCYERQLQMKPKLRGKMITKFTIGLDGRVTRTSVQRSTLQDQIVETCVLDVLKRLEFPKPGGGVVEVIYPFLFRIAI